MEENRNESTDKLQKYIMTVQEKQADEEAAKGDIEWIKKLFGSTMKRLQTAFSSTDFYDISFGMKNAEDMYLLIRKAFRTLSNGKEKIVFNKIPYPVSEAGVSVKMENGWLQFTLKDHLPHRLYSTKTEFDKIILDDLFKEIDMSGWDKRRKFWMFVNQIFVPKSYANAPDNDNVETKYFADALSGIVYEDDSPTYLTQTVTATIGEENKAEIYIVPVEIFEEFYKKIWKNIV